jgi:glyceraldehyde-3-phosphate dehydrogenase (NADP+)
MNSRIPLLQVRNPESGALIDEVPMTSPAMVERVVTSAHAARRDAAALAPHERAAILQRASALVTQRAEVFARCIAEEGIKTIREARREATRCAMTLQLAGEEARRLGAETMPLDAEPGGVHRIGWSRRVPVGVVVAITPYNDPLNLVAHKIAPAIAAGNTVILKPHPATPLSALALAAVMEEAGLPPNVLQVVIGGADVGAAVVSDRRVGMVSLTGGRAAGQAVASVAGVKRLSMELGGNCPTIVMQDADLDDAAQRCASGALWAAGQNCLHVQRILVHQDIYHTFRDRFVPAVQAFKPGPKLDEASGYGCMISDQHADAVASTIDHARSAGRLLAGGTRRERQIDAAVFEGIPIDHPAVAEEVFGPVTFLLPFSDLSQAVDMANAQPYGLQAAIFTRDIEAALHAADAIEVGALVVNDSTDWRVDGMPFGGVKGTGLGREGVRESILAMTELRLTAIRRSSPFATAS